MGDYRKEPSILLDNDLKRNLLNNFKLKDVDDLQGAVVFKILCHFIKLREKEMTHDHSNIRYPSCYSGIA